MSFRSLECFHIVGFALSIGTIAIVDFSLLGLGMRRESPAQLAKDTWLWTLGGLVVMFFSGLLLFSSDPDMYYLNWAVPDQNGLFRIGCHLSLHGASQSRVLRHPTAQRKAGGVGIAGVLVRGYFRRNLHRLRLPWTEHRSLLGSHRMLLSFAQWIQLTTFFTALRGSANVYPIVMSLAHGRHRAVRRNDPDDGHRLLGWAMRKRSIADVVEQFRVPKRWGLLLTATCGILLAGSKAEEYYYNAFFRTKLILFALVLVQELVFYRSVYANPAALDRAPSIPASAKLAAALSLLLWTSIACCGRGIGYIEPPLDKIHAQLHNADALVAWRGPSLPKGQDY